MKDRGGTLDAMHFQHILAHHTHGIAEMKRTYYPRNKYFKNAPRCLVSSSIPLQGQRLLHELPIPANAHGEKVELRHLCMSKLFHLRPRILARRHCKIHSNIPQRIERLHNVGEDALQRLVDTFLLS